ncbi:MAG: hypothetical protein H6935_08880 [Thiobacillus sp.]|nr:hypothetical protein [Thiobacillus sp.]
MKTKLASGLLACILAGSVQAGLDGIQPGNELRDRGHVVPLPVDEEALYDVIARFNQMARDRSKTEALLMVPPAKNEYAGVYAAAPPAGLTSRMPFNAALALFRGSGVRVRPGNCANATNPNLQHIPAYELNFSISGYQPQWQMRRDGIELSVDKGSGYGNTDTSDSFTRDILQVAWTLTACDPASDFEPAAGIHGVVGTSVTDAATIAVLAKVLGFYYVDSTTIAANIVEARESLMQYGVVEAATHLLGISRTEADLMTFGCTAALQSERGAVRVMPRCDIARFDPSKARLLLRVEHHSDRPPEEHFLDGWYDLRIDRLGSDVRRAYLTILYHDRAIYVTRIDDTNNHHFQGHTR